MYLLEDGLRVHIELELPGNAGERFPLAVIIHGFTGHMDERHLTAVSAALRECGCATLRADMYGHGKSEGAFREHTLYKWLTDALAVIDYGRGLKGVSQVFLCGHSQGGLTAMLAAGMKSDQLSGLIALSPACMIPDLARGGRLLGLHFDPVHIPDELPVWNGLQLGANYVRVAQTIHVEDAVERFSEPVLVVQGEDDDPVLVSAAKAAAGKYHDARLVMIPNETHCYDRHLEQMTEAVRHFVRSRLVSRGGGGPGCGKTT